MSIFAVKKTGLRNIGLVVIAMIALAGCKERDTILPGERHSIRPQENVVVQNAAAAISLGTPISDANWLQKSYGASHVVPHLALSAAPSLRWSVNIGRGNSDRSRITSDPVIANGVVYTLDAGSVVRAMSADSGGLIWSTELLPLLEKSGADGFGGGLAIANDTLFVGSGFGEMLALSTENGAVRWRYAFDAPIRSAPTVADGQVYFVSRDDVAHALNAATGALQWEIRGPHATNAGILGGASPAVNGSTVILPFSSGQIFAATTVGTVRWRADVNTTRLSTTRGTIGEITGDPVILNGRVYLANQGGQTASITLTNGNQNWSVAEGSLSPAAVIGGSLFTVTDRARLMRIDASTGTVIWAVQLPEYRNPKKHKGFIVHHGPIVAGGQVFVAGTDGQLRAFDPVSGAETYSANIPGGAASAPVIAAGIMYIQSQN
ncbi:MAG: PQQ-binding-like beta-propeller repeat protein, partial [Rhodobacteraceae bacterium]|nr:PQQ-binding-like beta-propeller repeat protein [Paracoccaceae bacterium]